MKIIRMNASVNLEYQVEDCVDVDDSLVDNIIAHQIESEVIAEVQNNVTYTVSEE